MKIRTINATITGFSYSDKGLTVYFTSGERKLRSLAHPALKVAPHIGNEETLKIAETEQGWKMLQPFPSEEDIKAWEKATAERAEIAEEASEAQIALLATF